MATQLEDEDLHDDAEDIEDEVEGDADEGDESEIGADDDEPGEGEESEGNDSGDDDEDVVSFGGAPLDGDEDDGAPAWAKELRKRHAEAVAERKRVEKENADLRARSGPTVNNPGDMPKAEDYDYDDEAYRAAVLKWTSDKTAYDQSVAQAERAKQDAEKAWQGKLESYGEQKTRLKVKDYLAAELAVSNDLSDEQTALLIGGAENKAALIYGLGRNEVERTKLAAIKDPVEFAFAAGRLEAKMQFGKRKPLTTPERPLRGSGGAAEGSDKKLERLEAEAAKTGNRSKIIAYKASMRSDN